LRAAASGSAQGREPAGGHYAGSSPAIAPQNLYCAPCLEMSGSGVGGPGPPLGRNALIWILVVVNQLY
jgi:hypothetical protein